MGSVIAQLIGLMLICAGFASAIFIGMAFLWIAGAGFLLMLAGGDW